MTCTGMNMKSSSTVFREKIQFGKVERCIDMGRRPVHFILSTLFIATIFSIFLLYSPNPLYLISKQGLEQQASSPMQGHKSHQSKFQNNLFFFVFPYKIMNFSFFFFSRGGCFWVKNRLLVL